MVAFDPLCVVSSLKDATKPSEQEEFETNWNKKVDTYLPTLQQS